VQTGLSLIQVHYSQVVKDWLEENKGKIVVLYLPSYSPELTPDEYLNGDLKHNIRSGLPARSLKEMTKKTVSFMRKLQNRLEHVRNYFKHPKIAYAAYFQCLTTGAILLTEL